MNPAARAAADARRTLPTNSPSSTPSASAPRPTPGSRNRPPPSASRRRTTHAPSSRPPRTPSSAAQSTSSGTPKRGGRKNALPGFARGGRWRSGRKGPMDHPPKGGWGHQPHRALIIDFPHGLSLRVLLPAGFLWRLTVRDAGRPPSLYTFKRPAACSARDSPRVPFRAAFPDFSRFLPSADVHIPHAPSCMDSCCLGFVAESW